MGKKRSQIIAARRRKTRDERKQAEREAERQEREVANGAGSLVEMKFKNDEMKSENGKKDSCFSDADNGSELVTNCESSTGTKPDESNLDKLSMLDVSIKCETDFLGKEGSEERIRPKIRLQAGEKSFACTQCDKKFAQRYQLGRHQRIHTGEKPIAREKTISCPQCDKKFIQMCRMKEHMLVHTDEKPFTCEACDKKFASKKRLRKHHAFHRADKLFICGECNRKFITQSGLIKHRICHTGEKLSCADCNKKFTSKDSLVRHRNALHSGERPRPYACPECDKRYYEKLHMTEHYKSHTGERPYVCEKCGNSYAQKSGFLYHRCLQTQTRRKTSTFTVPNGDGPFVCPICKKDFALKAVLRSHFNLHTDKFACSACGKSFCNGKNLKEHSYIHTGERPFVCDICGKDFSHKISFKVHMSLHKKDNKNLFPCSDCDMKFGCRSDLTAHRKIHGKKFSCDVCGKTFAEKRYLSAHTRTHTGEKPFACPYCDKTFACKSNLLVHRRRHTGERRTPRIPIVKVFSIDSRTIESPSPKNHVTKSSISDIDVIDSVHSFESEIMMESTAVNTGPLADDSFGEKSFACSQCDEKFARESDLHVYLAFHASERPTVNEPCTEELPSNRPPSKQVRRETERRDSTDSASTVDYHEMEKLISEINEKVYSRESGISIETRIDAGELKDVVPSSEPDMPVDAHSDEAGTNVLGGDVISDLDRCPSPVHSECSSNVACSVDSPEHSEVDTSEKLDVSSRCKMKFPDIASLYFQEVVHVINQKIYPCSACGMKFTRKLLMLAHRTSAHPGYMPFTCEVCKKTFAQKRPLKIHMQTHTRRKPYNCCRCDMGFSAKQAFKLHTRICYNEPYSCEICLKQFVNKGLLTKHLKKKCYVDPHCQTRTDENPSATVCVPHMQKDGPMEEITVEPDKNSPADIDVTSDPTDLATELKEMKRSKSGIDGNILSVDEVKKEYQDNGKEIAMSVHNDMLSDLSVGTTRGEPHVDRNPISKNCGTDLSVNSTSQVSDMHQSHSNVGCSTTPFETFRFIKILKYPRREKTHKCPHCDKKFANRAHVIAHQRIHTGEKPFSCSVCGQSFSRLSALKDHQINHSNVNPFSCSNCGMEFRNRGTYYYHRQMKCTRADVKPFLCMVCNKKFVCKSQLVNHFRNHTNEKPFVCHECDKKFTQAATLKLHMRTHSGENPVCTVCDKKFSHMGALNVHLRIHTGEKPFICELCGKNFARNHSLEKHMKTHSNKKKEPRVGSNFNVMPTIVAGEMSFMCEICGKNFPSLNKLKTHSKIHTDEKSRTSFTCADCDMEFRQKRRLNWHRIKFHSGECPFSCPDCPESFSKYSLLTKHQIINHAGDKAFVCPVCGKKFLQKSILNRHMKYHTGEKSFECPDCHKRFLLRGQLNTHHRKHTGEKPYACSDCDMRFTFKNGLDYHRKTNHRYAKVPLEQNINRRAFQSFTSSP